MNVVVRLLILLMLFLTSQSGIATTTKFTAHQYDVNHIALSENIYGYDTHSNPRHCCQIPLAVNTQDRSFFAFVSDFLATKSETKINPKIYNQLEKQLQRDGEKSIHKALRGAEKALKSHQDKLPSLKYKSQVEGTIRNVGNQIKTLKQFIKDKDL